MRNVRRNHRLYRSLLALSVIGALSACNSSGGGDTNSSTPLPDTSYACQANVMAQSNQLRTYQIMVESFVDGD
ncbi:glycosidase, partial [Vibrio antiquarius]